jgi:multidrug efflux pump subunit AcrA (membrane-fusion protein)
MAFAKAKSSPATQTAVVRAILVVALGAATFSRTEGRAQSPSPSVAVVKAVSGCFVSAVRFTGLVVPRAEAIVNLDADGYQISEVLVTEGDIVTSGQVLARMTRLASAALASGSGAAGALSPAGAAGIPQPPATKRLTAPAGGLVSKSTAKVGAIANAIPLPPPMGPEPLFRIIIDNKLEIEADVPSVHLPKLEAGQLARARLENGRELNGQVRTILPEIDRRTQLGKVRLDIDNDPAIRAGTFASGTIDASHSCGVSIPRSAVEYRTEGATVQIVRDTTVVTRHVGLGFFSNTDIEVKDGVEEGDLVIANAGTSLHDGDEVKPTFADDFSRREPH